MKDGHNIATIRAEQNTITNCAKRGTSSNGCTVYVTHYLCYNCMKLIVSSGTCEIKYINNYKNDPLVSDLAVVANISINQI
jgi:dCMP deaminase